MLNIFRTFCLSVFLTTLASQAFGQDKSMVILPSAPKTSGAVRPGNPDSDKPNSPYPGKPGRPGSGKPDGKPSRPHHNMHWPYWDGCQPYCGGVWYGYYDIDRYYEERSAKEKKKEEEKAGNSPAAPDQPREPERPFSPGTFEKFDDPRDAALESEAAKSRQAQNQDALEYYQRMMRAWQ